jgi:hypothetical protein
MSFVAQAFSFWLVFFLLLCYREFAPERTLDDIFFTDSLCLTAGLWIL